MVVTTVPLYPEQELNKTFRGYFTTQRNNVSCTWYKRSTFLAFGSSGCRHSGELLRALLTIDETGWNVRQDLDWSNLRASSERTSPKSNHRLTSSSPSRMAGILSHTCTHTHGGTNDCPWSNNPQKSIQWTLRLTYGCVAWVMIQCRALPVVDALQVWRGVHSDHGVGVQNLPTTRRSPAVKQPRYGEQTPSRPLTALFGVLLKETNRTFVFQCVLKKKKNTSIDFTSPRTSRMRSERLPIEPHHK